MTRRNDMEPGMNETLKAAGHIGAELGAARAESEKLRELLRRYVDLFTGVRLAGQAKLLDAEARTALSLQAEPVEPAPAQDEREVAAVIGFYEGEREPRLLSWNVLPNGEHRLYTRPAQTEQKPEYPHDSMDAIALARYHVVPSGPSTLHRYAVRAGDGECELYRGSRSDCEHVARKLAGAFLDGGLTATEFHAAPIAQTAPKQVQKGALDCVPELEAIAAALSAVTAERDRLLSDNASLRGSCKALGEENKQLKRENKRQGRTIAAMDAKEE